jgi:hypothetical protein
MPTSHRRRLAAATTILFALLAIAIAVPPLWSRPDAQRIGHGEIVLLRGTPHYWVADERGVLHWPGDTRALAGRYVRWDRVRELSAEQLERLPRGEPWLPSPVAFVRASSPGQRGAAAGAGGAIYLVRWHTGMRWPALLRLPPLESLAPFGITPDLVSRLSIDDDTWERLHDQRVETTAVDFGPLPGAATAPTPPTDALPLGWRTGSFGGTGTQDFPSATYPVRIMLTRLTPDPMLGIVAGAVSYPSFPCGGPLGLLTMDAQRMELTERFASGLEHCTDQGRVSLERQADGTLFYVWSLPHTGPGGETSVTAVLRPEGG